MSEAAAARLNFSSQYWTAYLNVSYTDSDRNVWHTERTETGRFGSGGPKPGRGVAVELLSATVRGDVASGDGYDRSGCKAPFQENYPSSEPWIAIIRRGKCTFNEKIANALALNASGVLVYKLT